jgi:hypothetical protein
MTQAEAKPTSFGERDADVRGLGVGCGAYCGQEIPWKPHPRGACHPQLRPRELVELAAARVRFPGLPVTRPRSLSAPTSTEVQWAAFIERTLRIAEIVYEVVLPAAARALPMR